MVCSVIKVMGLYVILLMEAIAQLMTI